MRIINVEIETHNMYKKYLNISTLKFKSPFLRGFWGKG